MEKLNLSNNDELINICIKDGDTLISDKEKEDYLLNNFERIFEDLQSSQELLVKRSLSDLVHSLPVNSDTVVLHILRDSNCDIFSQLFEVTNYKESIYEILIGCVTTKDDNIILMFMTTELFKKLLFNIFNPCYYSSNIKLFSSLLTRENTIFSFILYNSKILGNAVDILLNNGISYDFVEFLLDIVTAFMNFDVNDMEEICNNFKALTINYEFSFIDKKNILKTFKNTNIMDINTPIHDILKFLFTQDLHPNLYLKMIDILQRYLSSCNCKKYISNIVLNEIGFTNNILKFTNIHNIDLTYNMLILIDKVMEHQETISSDQDDLFFYILNKCIHSEIEILYSTAMLTASKVIESTNTGVRSVLKYIDSLTEFVEVTTLKNKIDAINIIFNIASKFLDAKLIKPSIYSIIASILENDVSEKKSIIHIMTQFVDNTKSKLFKKKVMESDIYEILCDLQDSDEFEVSMSSIEFFNVFNDI